MELPPLTLTTSSWDSYYRPYSYLKLTYLCCYFFPHVGLFNTYLLPCLELGLAHRRCWQCGVTDTWDIEIDAKDNPWLVMRSGFLKDATFTFSDSGWLEVCKGGKGVFHMEELFVREMDEGKDCTSGIQGLGAIQCGGVGVIGCERSSRALIGSPIHHGKEWSSSHVAGVPPWVCICVNAAENWAHSQIPMQGRLLDLQQSSIPSSPEWSI